MQCNEIRELTTVLRENGDKILDASSKLSLSTTLISKMNASFASILSHTESYTSSFHVLNGSNNLIDQFLDLQLIYDFVQKTVALKILPGVDVLSNQFIDIGIFRNLKFLEIHRFSLNIIKGLCYLRTRLEYLICKRSINTLEEVLENCGADKACGFIWSELKEAVFSHNGLDNLDGSLEFVPGLHSIDLSHNHIRDAQSLSCLPNLKYLNLSFNEIENVPAFTGQLCNMLQILILRNNYIDDIRELSLLINLRELDLSHNCLIDHSCLAALSNLSALRKLGLQGNPLSYHPRHRNQTAQYLHVNALSVHFLLENSVLSKSELRLVGSFQPVYVPLELSSSFNSTTTENTIIPNVPVPQVAFDPSNTGNRETSAEYGVVNELSNENTWLQNSTTQDSQGMQDSGFVAEPRPVSPSECSIGSATSLESEGRPSEQAVKYCESDIEVLSNPSQSSIEVLSNRSAPRCVQSSSAIFTQTIHEISTNNDLKKSMTEMHRSF